jgi:hypothetical protein
MADIGLKEQQRPAPDISFAPDNAEYEIWLFEQVAGTLSVGPLGGMFQNPPQGGGDPSPLLILSSLLGTSSLRNLTLPGDAGAFSVSGQAATLKYGRLVVGAAGSFVLSGQNASLNYGKTLVSAVGTFSLSGQAATLRATRLIAGGAGSFTLTGQAATLTYVPAGNQGGGFPSPLLILSTLFGVDPRSNPGSFILTGQAAILKSGRRLVCAAGSYALSGQAATLTKSSLNAGGDPAPLLILSTLLTPSATNRSIYGAPGAFVVSGQAATLTKGRALFADTGSFIVSGAPAERDMEMNGDTGAFVLSGQPAGLTRTYTALACDAGSFVVTGRDAILRKETAGQRILGAFPGGFVVTGNDAGSVYTRNLQCDAGAFGVSGQNASLRWSEERLFVTGAGKIGRTKRRVVVTYKDQEYVIPAGTEEAFLASLIDGEPVIPKEPKRIRAKRKERRREKLPEVVVPEVAGIVFPDYPQIKRDLEKEAELQRILDQVVARKLQELDDEEAIALLIT